MTELVKDHMTEMYREAERLAAEPKNQAEALDVPQDIAEAAGRAADLIGVTKYSDMRIFVEHAVRYALLAERARASLPEAPAAGVNIKPLEWGEIRHVPDGPWSETMLRQRIGHHNLGRYAGSYSVQEVSVGGPWGWWNTWTADREPDGVEPTEEAAKAAAQADFEARIRSALLSSPPVQTAAVDGYVLVPREPTEAMLKAPYDADIDFGPGGTSDIQANPMNVWQAMVDAALASQAAVDAGVREALPATGPYVDRIIRIFRDRPDNDTSAVVLQDYARASLSLAAKRGQAE